MFHLELDPSPDVVAQAEAAAPTNPFCTAGYLAARAALGERPVLLFVPQMEGPAQSCAAFMTRGRARRTLEMPSAPAITDPQAFVRGLEAACRQLGITDVVVNTFASPLTVIPPLAGEVNRYARTEFVIDLDGEDPITRMSRSHRQRARQGEKAGLRLRRAADPAACDRHVALIEASMQRRRARDESVPTADARPLRALLAHGAGELFQAVADDRVVGSMLLLRSRAGAYDQSSGFAPEGMDVGAAQFLIRAAAVALRAESCEVLNLGGAREEETGLRAFKTHFGARTVSLEAVAADRAGPLRHIVSAAAALVRSAASRLTARRH